MNAVITTDNAAPAPSNPPQVLEITPRQAARFLTGAAVVCMGLVATAIDVTSEMVRFGQARSEAFEQFFKAATDDNCDRKKIYGQPINFGAEGVTGFSRDYQEWTVRNFTIESPDIRSNVAGTAAARETLRVNVERINENNVIKTTSADTQNFSRACAIKLVFKPDSGVN